MSYHKILFRDFLVKLILEIYDLLPGHLSVEVNSLDKNGVLLLSGFFDSDVDELVEFSSQFNLRMNKVYSKETWAGIQLIKD